MNRDPGKFQKKSAEVCPGAFSSDEPESPVNDDGGYGDPHAHIEDTRPDFVRADEEGWTQHGYDERSAKPARVASASRRT